MEEDEFRFIGWLVDYLLESVPCKKEGKKERKKDEEEEDDERVI